MLKELSQRSQMLQEAQRYAAGNVLVRLRAIKHPSLSLGPPTAKRSASNRMAPGHPVVAPA
jgi:hypothetical protein